MASLSGKSIKNRIQLAKYYLQFCAINSQLKNHSKAVNAGHKAILIIKALLKELHLTSNSAKEPPSSPIVKVSPDFEEQELKQKVVAGISRIEDEARVERCDKYLRTARYYFKKWNIRKQGEKEEELKEWLKNFSIGNIMQMRPLSFEENRESTLDHENM